MVFSFEKFLRFFHFRPTKKEESPITCVGCRYLVYYNDGSVTCEYGHGFSRCCVDNNFKFKKQERIKP